MNYRRFGDKYVVRLEKGEELVESIKELAKKRRYYARKSFWNGSSK